MLLPVACAPPMQRYNDGALYSLRRHVISSPRIRYETQTVAYLVCIHWTLRSRWWLLDWFPAAREELDERHPRHIPRRVNPRRISPRRLCAQALKHDSLDNPREEWDQSHPLRPQSPRFALAAGAASSDVVLAARGRGAATRWERDTKKVHSHCLPAGAQNCKCGSTTTWSKAKTCTNWIAKTCELKPRNAVSF